MVFGFALLGIIVDTAWIMVSHFGSESPIAPILGLTPTQAALIAIALLSLLIWVVLLGFWGNFWRGSERLSTPMNSPTNRLTNTPTRTSAPRQLSEERESPVSNAPSVIAIVPARNEAEVLPETLRSLLSQRYVGRLRILLVDDGSTDGTGELAHRLARTLPHVEIVSEDLSTTGTPNPRTEPQGDTAADRRRPSTQPAIEFAIISPPPLPQGWTGKLWALDRGIAAARAHWGDPDYLWLTDADICHTPDNLQRLVEHARNDRRELVSLMVQLRCESLWERLMVPAFIFFFQKLYPFPWVNDPEQAMAAAAGGCILLQTQTLDRIGGLSCVRQALIDDCALAWAVKHSEPQESEPQEWEAPLNPDPTNPIPHTYRRIWLGLSDTTHSLRPYDSLASLWEMVARTAYTQLNYSPWLLLGTIVGMILVYLVPPFSVIGGFAFHLLPLASLGGLTWGGMVVAYRPTLRSYGQPTLLGVLLPAIATLYLFATIDSAWRHWRGYGGAWKGRTYTKH